MMAKEVSVSLAYGEGVAEAHDRRDYTPDNAEKSLADRNVEIIGCPSIKDAVNEFYGPAVERYNARQKRTDRKKSLDYYGALLDGTEGYGVGASHEKPVYEYVLQVGNKDDNGVTDSNFDVEFWRAAKERGDYNKAAQYVKQHLNTDPDRAELKEILIDYAQKLPERYPNLHFLMMEYHDDEPGGTGHIHMMFTPFVNGQKTGLDTRVSMSGAFKSMGFVGGPNEKPLELWKNDLKDGLTEAMQARGYDRKFMSNTEEHLSVSNYKRMQESERLDREIAEKKKESANLSWKNKIVQEDLEDAKSELEDVKAELADAQSESRALREENEALKTALKQAQESVERDLEPFVARDRDFFKMALKSAQNPTDGLILAAMKQMTMKGTGKTAYEFWAEQATRFANKKGERVMKTIDETRDRKAQQVRETPDISAIEQNRRRREEAEEEDGYV